MDEKGWNQAQVANYLEADRSLVTRVLKYGQKLHPGLRKLLELLLKETEE